MRILVTGSRKWTDVDAVWGSLDLLAEQAKNLGEEMVVVHGAAEGADELADKWVRGRRLVGWPVTAERHKAQWKQHGRRAGFLRNQRMVDRGADVCLAFVLDESRGASMCADLAERAGIPVQRIERNSEGAS